MVGEGSHQNGGLFQKTDSVIHDTVGGLHYHSENHRNIEWPGSEGTFKTTKF